MLCYGVVCDVNIVVLIDVVDEVWCDGMVWYGMVWCRVRLTHSG